MATLKQKVARQMARGFIHETEYGKCVVCQFERDLIFKTCISCAEFLDRVGHNEYRDRLTGQIYILEDFKNGA